MGHLYHGYVSHNQRLSLFDQLEPNAAEGSEANSTVWGISGCEPLPKVSRMVVATPKKRKKMVKETAEVLTHNQYKMEDKTSD